MAGIHRDKEGNTEYKVFKALGLPEELYWNYQEEFKNDLYTPKDPICLLGHNRYATQGKIDAVSAHPFEYEHVVGAHNGTVNQWSLKDFHNYRELHIDSQIIYSEIDHKNNLQNVWDNAEGAMALTWWDKRDDCLHIARNNKRPLCYAKNKHKETIYWASEPWMLNVVLNKLNITHEGVKEITEDTHYTISFKENKLEVKREKLNPFVSKWSNASYGGHWKNQNVNQVFQKSSPPSGHNGGLALPPPSDETIWIKITEYNQTGLNQHEGAFFGLINDDPEKEVRISIQGNGNKDWYEGIMEAVNTKRPYFVTKKRSLYNMYNMTNVHVTNLEHRKHVIKLHTDSEKKVKKNYIEGFGGELLDKKRFEAVCKEGCCVCGTFKLNWADAKNYVFLDKDMIVCQECKSDDWVKDLISESFSLKN